MSETMDARTAVLHFNSRLTTALEALGKANKNWPPILGNSLSNIRQSLIGCHLIQMTNDDTAKTVYITAGGPTIPLETLRAPPGKSNA